MRFNGEKTLNIEMIRLCGLWDIDLSLLVTTSEYSSDCVVRCHLSQPYGLAVYRFNIIDKLGGFDITSSENKKYFII